VRARAILLAVVVAALAFPAGAGAARIVTWTTTSRWVDPSKATSGYNHPGAPARPNALRVNVVLPDGYDPRGTRRYPVLYLLHGVGDAYDSWSLPGQGEILDVARGFPGFIVMPEADRGFYTNWWNGGRRGDPGWERYHLDELIPLVESRLPILRGRRWHAVHGFSMGGMGAVFYASQRPGYFGSAGASQGLLSLERPEFQQDPVFRAFIEQDRNAIFGDPAAQGFYWAGHNPLKLVENLRSTRLYVAVGDGVPLPGESTGQGQLAEIELRNQADEFVAAARGAGVEVDYRPQQGTHDWPSRRKHLRDAIAWGFFEPVRESPSSWVYRTVASEGVAWGLRYAFGRAPDAMAVLSREGDVLRVAGASGTVTISTPDGCRFTAAAPFERRIPSGCRRVRVLRLTVVPSVVRAGTRRRFTFRVTGREAGGSGADAAPGAPHVRAIPRARVRFAGRSVLTDARGRATMTRVLSRPARFRPQATKPGWPLARSRVTVVAR
jgi:S-formylglutathione hydrolase FrmB